MKRIIIMLAAACGFSGEICAQTLPAENHSTRKNYFTLKAGYSFASNRTEQLFFTVDQTGFNTSLHRYSLGKGLAVEAGAGTFFNDNIGAELNAGVNIGLSSEFSYKYSQWGDLGPYWLKYKDSGRGNSYYLNPNLVAQFSLGRFVPYLKAGVQLAYLTASQETEQSIDSTDWITKSKWKYKGRVDVGISKTVGVRIKDVAPNLDVFAELSHVLLNAKFRKAELVSYEVNDQDRLAELNTSQKEIEFTDNPSYDYLGNPDKPAQQLARKTSFSRVSVSAGLMFRF